MDPNELAILIAGISLGVSLATFGWRIIYDIYFDAARLKVELRGVVITFGRDTVDAYAITVTNKGKRPTTLTSLWLHFGSPYRWQRRLPIPQELRTKLFKTAILMPGTEFGHLNAVLPKLLGVGDQAQVFYARVMVHTNVKETKWKHVFGQADATTTTKASNRLKVR